MSYLFYRWGRTRSVLLQAMRLRCAVLKIPAKSSVPSGLPLNKKRSLRTHSESTLPQLLISPHFNSFRCNAYKKTGRGRAVQDPKFCNSSLAASCSCAHARIPVTLIPSVLYIITRGYPGGVGYLRVGQPIFLAVLSRSVPRITGHESPATEHGSRSMIHETRASSPWSPGTVAPQLAKCQNREC